MASLTIKQVECNSVDVPAYVDSDILGTNSQVVWWGTPFLLPVHVKIIKGAYGGGINARTQERIMAQPFHLGPPGRFQSLESPLPYADNTCYELSVPPRLSLYVRFRIECVVDYTRHENMQLRVTDLSNNSYLISFTSLITNNDVSFLVWK
jgi:hypothetical protein